MGYYAFIDPVKNIIVNSFFVDSDVSLKNDNHLSKIEITEEIYNQLDGKWASFEISDGVVRILELKEPVRESNIEEQLAEKEKEIQLLKAQNKAISERADFIEEVIVEMAMQVYQ